MNHEYWKLVLLGKPRIWFYITVVLFIATGYFLLMDWKQGRVVAMPALVFAVIAWLGWMDPEGPDDDFPEIKKRRRPWLGFMVLLLAVPVTLSCIESYRESKKDPDYSVLGFSRELWNIGKDMFSKEPPLLIRNERRNESFGLEKVEFLIITNKSGEGLVPIKATIQSAKQTFPISLPPVIKPYETIEVRLQKWFIEKGQSLTVECEGYSKPFKATYQ